MGPITAFSSFFTRYFDVNGRARRSEYGWMIIIQVIAFIMTAIAIGFIEGTPDELDTENLSAAATVLLSLMSLVWLGTLIPWLTLSIRRFHDMNLTGWLVALFIGLWVIPPIGALGSMMQFIWLLLGNGSAGANAYGQDPRFARGMDFV